MTPYEIARDAVDNLRAADVLPALDPESRGHLVSTIAALIEDAELRGANRKGEGK